MIDERVILLECEDGCGPFGGDDRGAGDIGGIGGTECVLPEAGCSAGDVAQRVPEDGTSVDRDDARARSLRAGAVAGRMRVPVRAEPPAFSGFAGEGAIESVLSAGEALMGVGGRALTIQLAADPGVCESDYLQAAHEILQAVRFESQRTGVAVAIECGVGASITSIGELARVIDDAASWSVGACLRVDFGHELGPQLGALRRLAGRVHVVRVARAAEGAGDVDAEALLADLAAGLNAARFERVVVLPSAHARNASLLCGS